MKESEAKKTVCPIMSSWAPGHLYGDGSSEPPEFNQHNCLGSECAMWESWEFVQDGNFTSPPVEPAGSPKWVLVETMEQPPHRYQRVTQKGEGDCGLKGKIAEVNTYG